jgi:uncharacterized protein YutE (UPF0331/DUF86 family)
VVDAERLHRVLRRISEDLTTLDGYAVRDPDDVLADPAWLGRHGVVDVEVAERVATAVGFRNLLVHQYAVIDDRVVAGYLQRLADLHAYVTELSALLDG